MIYCDGGVKISELEVLINGVVTCCLQEEEELSEPSSVLP